MIDHTGFNVRDIAASRAFYSAVLAPLGMAIKRDLGFAVENIRTLLKLSDTPGMACDEAHAISVAHLDEVRDKIARLRSLEKELERIAIARGYSFHWIRKMCEIKHIPMRRCAGK